MGQRDRSPWSGLTGAQSLTLADALSAQLGAVETAEQAAWRAHETFARRAALALVGNDLRGALDAAEISAAALRLWQREGPTDVPGERQAVVHQHPAAAGGTEAGPSAWAAHRPHRALTR